MEDTAILSFFRPSGLAPGAVAVVATVLLNRLLAGVFRNLTERFSASRFTIEQLGTLVRFAIYFVGVTIAVTFIFQLSDQALLTLGGTAAVTIGFALKDVAAAVLAGVTILMDRPFQVGDRITFGGVYGEVKAIGLRSVTLVTLDDNLVTIPNNKLLTDVVSSGNAGELDMLVQQDFYIDPGADISLARAIVSEALVTCPYASLKKPWTVVVSQDKLANSFAVRLRAQVYVLDVRHELALVTDVSERVIEGLQQAAIAPFTRTGPGRRDDAMGAVA
jgi:small-conductance mechanosensitive channel